jgi:hypothetical protein
MSMNGAPKTLSEKKELDKNLVVSFQTIPSLKNKKFNVISVKQI